MKKFTKIAAFVFAVCLGATAMTACGDSKDDKKTDDKKPKASSIDDMDEEDLEAALNKLDEETSKELEKEKEEATEAETEPTTVAEIKYEATDEIKNAPLNSGCIQIGDTVFRTGGYMTAAELVELCDGKFDTSEIHLDEYLPSKGGAGVSYKIRSIKDPRIEVTVSLFKPNDAADEKVKIPDAIVLQVEMKFYDGEQYCLTDGIGGDAAAYLEDVIFFPMNMGLMEYDDIKAFVAEQGLTKSESSFIEPGKYIEDDDSITIELEGEENLMGDKPRIMYRFKYDPKTLKGTDLRFSII